MDFVATFDSWSQRKQAVSLYFLVCEFSFGRMELRAKAPKKDFGAILLGHHVDAPIRPIEECSHLVVDGPRKVAQGEFLHCLEIMSLTLSRNVDIVR